MQGDGVHVDTSQMSQKEEMSSRDEKLSDAKGHVCNEIMGTHIPLEVVLEARNKMWHQTPLHKPSFYGRDNSVAFLLGDGAQLDTTDRTPLHLAERREFDSCGLISLEPKAQLGHECNETMRTLIALGADLEVRSGVWQQTPLHLAAFNGRDNNVAFLIEAGAQLDATDSNLHTPLHLAAMRGYDSSVSILLKSGANLGARSNEYWTPLHCAVCNGKLSTTKLLVEAGASVNAQQRCEMSPLYLASLFGHTNIVDYLSSVGAVI